MKPSLRERIEYLFRGTNHSVAKLIEDSTKDQLTGLYNRRGFDESFSKLMMGSSRDDTLVGLIFIDLDEFKRINDNMGYSIGDDILRESAYTMNGILRREEIIGRCKNYGVTGRYGGDEFMIGLEVENWNNMEMAAYRIKRDITRSFEDNFRLKHLPGFSCGYAAANLYYDRTHNSIMQTGSDITLCGHILYMIGQSLKREEFKGNPRKALDILREKASSDMQERKRKKKLYGR